MKLTTALYEAMRQSRETSCGAAVRLRTDGSYVVEVEEQEENSDFPVLVVVYCYAPDEYNLEEEG